jgi:hypothetical protein
VAGSWTQGFAHVRQIHYHWTISPALNWSLNKIEAYFSKLWQVFHEVVKIQSLFIYLFIFETGSHYVIQVGPELAMLLSTSQMLGLQLWTTTPSSRLFLSYCCSIPRMLPVPRGPRWSSTTTTVPPTVKAVKWRRWLALPLTCRTQVVQTISSLILLNRM